jgi:hypothetical protein
VRTDVDNDDKQCKQRQAHSTHKENSRTEKGVNETNEDSEREPEEKDGEFNSDFIKEDKIEPRQRERKETVFIKFE